MPVTYMVFLCFFSTAQLAPLSTIEAARDAIRRGRGQIGDLSLASVSRTWELPVGSKRILVLSTGNIEGGIAVFDEQGRRVDYASIGAPVGVELSDLDFDGTDELITDEVRGHGTGNLSRLFHIYHFDKAGTLHDVWSGDSLYYTPTEGPRRGYLKYEPSSAESPGYAIEHLVIDERTGKSVTRVMQLVDGVVRPVTSGRAGR